MLMYIGIGLLNVVALFLLCRQLFGTRAALWAGFFYAVMPAAMLYDLWLKQDPLVSLFGMLSIYAFLRNRSAVSGLLMGFAFLAKEMAVVYVIGLCMVWVLQPRGRRRFADLLIAGIATAVTAGWWFVFFSSSVKYYFAVMTGLPVVKTDAYVWSKPWHYYFSILPLSLGWVGVVLLGAGAASSLAAWARRRRAVLLWVLLFPLTVVVLMSLPETKASWFLTVLLPLFAVLEGVGMDGIVDRTRDIAGRRSGVVGAGVGMCVVLLGVSAVWGLDYETYLRRQDAGLWWGAAASRDTAEAMNRVAKEGDKALITPMYYWENRDIHPCPIMVYYMIDIPVVVRPYDVSLDEVVSAVNEYDLDWVMMAGEPGVFEREIIRPLMKDYGINPLILPGSIVFPAEGLKTEDGRRKTE